MKSFLKNVVLFGVVLLLSRFTAQWFGYWYIKIVPDALNGAWIGTQRAWEDIIGFPFAYVFFLTLIFKLFSIKTKWILILLIPPTLLYVLVDVQHIYLPVILGLIAFALAKIINIIVGKLKH